MSAKLGILHDYDLMANVEPAARGVKCACCDAEPMSFQWSDYHGEGMCVRCGCPYQLKAGSKEMEAEGSYPYLNLNEAYVEPVRAYYEETRRFTYLGSGFSTPGLREFLEWVEVNRPHLMRDAEVTP